MKLYNHFKIQFNYSFTLTNYLNAMKTKKYFSMLKAIAAFSMMFAISSIVFSQTIEERKGGTSTYSVTPGAVTDEYTWTIEAPVAPASVVPAPTSGTGTTGDPFIIDWTADLTSIQVNWAADASPDIASTAGIVTVQKRTTTGAVCPSPVQTLDISFWSIPSAVIDPAETDLDVCSTDPITGSITIDLTGAPDAGESGTGGFEVVYDVAVSDVGLTVTGGNGPIGAGQSVTSDGATVTIPLPDALVNTTASAQTYTITLVSVEDDFDDGPYAVAGEVYTITVNPTPTTGIIQSTGTLNRR